MTSTVVPPFLGDAASLVVRAFGLRPFHTDGDLLAIGFTPDGTLWSVEEPGVLRNWDLHAQKQTEWHPLEEIATLWSFNASSRLVAAGSDELSIWVCPTGEQLANWTVPSWTTAMAFSPDSQLLATGHDDAVLRLWDWHGPSLAQELHGHSMPISALAFSPDGQRLASAGEDRIIRIWSLPSGQLLGCLVGHTDRIPTLAWHPDGRRLVSAGWDTTARVWNTETFEPIILLNSHAGQVHTLAFSPEGRLLACADSASSVHIWDFDNSRTIGVLRDQARECTCLAFSPDGQRLAGGGADHVISIWDAKRELEPELIGSPQLSQTYLAAAPDGQRVLSLGAGTALRIWDALTTESILQLQETSALRAFALSPDGQWIAASLSPAENPDRPLLALYQAAAGQRQAVLDGQKDPVTTFAFSPDSRQVASASFQGTDVWLWGVPEGEPLLLIPNAADACSIDTLAFHPQGRLLAVTGIDYMSTSGSDGLVVLWDLVDRKEVRRFRGGATRAAFAPAGNKLAVCSLVQSIRLWDLTTGKLANELLGHLEAVTCVAYSPDGRWIASGGDDRTVRLWDAATGNPLGVVELDSQIKAVAFSADGRNLYTGNANTSSYQLNVKQLAAEAN
jgi:WD40 repeat protein